MKKITIKVERYQHLIDILEDKRKVFRLACIICAIGLALFFGITMLCLQLKKSFTYSDITTNAFGATTIADEQKQVSYFLFNTAELWANSGIRVEAGDLISVYSSGSAHTAIHHLQKAATSNTMPDEDYFDAQGSRTRYGIDRDRVRRKHRLAAYLPQSALIMQVYSGNGKPAKRPLENDPNFYYIAQHRENILINEGGTLYFAINDIVLDSATITLMKEDNFQAMMDTATTDEKEFLKKNKEYITGTFAKEDKALIKKKGDYDLYKALLKKSPFTFGPYYIDTTKNPKSDMQTWKTELDYYLENNYYKAWYDDNVGSFLIVVEKNYRK